MNFKRTVGPLLVVVATVTAWAAVAATTAPIASTTTATVPAGKHWRHHGSMLVGLTLRATKQLNLTSDQQQQIKTILATARSQHKQAAAQSLDMSVLGNPGDPNYSSAVQSAKSLAAERLQNQIELQSQIYNVLTKEQKAQLPQVLAAMKAKAEQRRAAWQQQHSTPASGTN